MINEIRQKIAGGQYEYSKHAVDQAIKRHISVQEVSEAVSSQSLIIEDCLDQSQYQEKIKWEA